MNKPSTTPITSATLSEKKITIAKEIIKKETPLKILAEQKESKKEITKNYSKSTLNIAMELIKKYECGGGPILKAYHDHTHYSIGCGTPSYKGEVITVAEAYRRYELEVMARVDKVMIDFPTYSPSQQAALASLKFNCPSVYNWLARTGVTESKFKSCNTASGRVLKGLVKRRSEEWLVYISNQM